MKKPNAPAANAVLRPVHPFPARMAPAIVFDELRKTKRPLTVLDPMSGSGTTVAVARLLGHTGLGFDTDPLAVLIARSWSFNVNATELQTRAELVLARARILAPSIPLCEAYPIDANAETKEFVRYWFDPVCRRQLAALSLKIAGVRDEQTRTLLWCALSRLIIVKNAGASLAMDVSHSRPHKVFKVAPLRPFDGFERALRTVISNAPFDGRCESPPAAVELGDARLLPLPENTVDIVVTSPPYLNAIDYLRGHKFSLIWMKHQIADLRSVRATNVGTEVTRDGAATSMVERSAVAAMAKRSLSERHNGMLGRYVRDMSKVFSEISRVLKPGGRAIMVVGNSTIRGTFVENSRGLEVLGAAAGLKLLRRHRRALEPNKRYLPPPESKQSGEQLVTRMREEVILTFSRP